VHEPVLLAEVFPDGEFDVDPARFHRVMRAPIIHAFWAANDRARVLEVGIAG